MPGLTDDFTDGAQSLDVAHAAHWDSRRPGESPSQTQMSPASSVRARGNLDSLTVLGKRLIMSRPSRHTSYELTWFEIAILGLLVVGVLSVVALCVAVALQ
jgi:cytochrome oxidase assembly protein ShyY1